MAVGVVRRTHGLTGEVLVEPLGDFADIFGPGVDCVWKSGERARDVTVSGKRGHTGRMILAFEGIAATLKLEDPERFADTLSAHLAVATPEKQTLLEAETAAGQLLGTVELLEETPAGPQLTLRTPAGKEVLVPFVHPIVVSIDAPAQRIVLDLPDGLMDL